MPAHPDTPEPEPATDAEPIPVGSQFARRLASRSLREVPYAERPALFDGLSAAERAAALASLDGEDANAAFSNVMTPDERRAYLAPIRARQVAQGQAETAERNARKAAAEEQAATAVDTSWEPLDLSPYLDGSYVRPRPSVLARRGGGAALYPGKYNALHGFSETLKTYIALCAAEEQLAAGEDVVWVEWEDDAATNVGRLVMLGAEPKAIRERFHFYRPSGPPSPAVLATLLDLVRDTSPTLAVVDGVTEAMAAAGLDPNAGTDVATFVASLPLPLALGGPAVVSIDHARRGNDVGGDAIGSVHKRNIVTGVAYEVRSVVRAAPGVPGMSRLIVTKDRPGSVRALCPDSDRRAFADFHLAPAFDGESPDALSWRLEPTAPATVTDGEGMRPLREMERITSALAELGPLNSRALRGAVEGKSDRKDLGLVVLIEEGYVEVKEGPNRERVHHLAKRYTATDDPKNPARGGAR